ncbi:MAG: hypothetical protein ACK4GN_06205 [Runella sp.]
MSYQIIFKQTGNFWIDNGLVSLRKTLLSLKDELSKLGQQYEAKLSNDGLLIIIESGEASTILNAAKNKAAENYLTETANSGWILKDGQFEVYQRTDFKMALKPFFTGKTPSTEGALCVPFEKERIKKLIPDKYKIKVPNDTKKSEEDAAIVLELQIVVNDKEQKKEYTVPTSKSDAAGKSGRFMTDEEFTQFLDFAVSTMKDRNLKLDGKGFLNTKPRYEIGETFSNDFFLSGKKRCYFSGESLKLVEGVSGMDYPFVK